MGRGGRIRGEPGGGMGEVVKVWSDPSVVPVALVASIR